MTQPRDQQPDSPSKVVRRFLEALEAAEFDEAQSLLDQDVVYTNVSLPTISGSEAVMKGFRSALERTEFRVHFHAIGSDDANSAVVLTDRTDAFVFGPVSVQFWVYGRFEVLDGKITLWRDSFDWRDVLMGFVRGIVGVGLPFVRRSWPTSDDLPRQ